MSRVVIDTNVFVSSFFGGLPREIINLWKEGRVTLCLSQEIVDEYLEVLNRLGLKNRKEIDQLAQLFAEGWNALYTTETPKLQVIEADPDDDKFLECAVALQSKLIISGDRHLKDLKKYIDIEILSPREFIDRHHGL